MYPNGPTHSQPNYANASSLYYGSHNGSPNSTTQQQPYSPLSKSPSSSINRSNNRSQPSALQQQLISGSSTHQLATNQVTNPQQSTYISTGTPTNQTTSPSLNVSHNSNSMITISHRSKSVDLLNSNDNSNGSSSHSTSSLGQQIKMNNAQSPLNTLLNNSNNSNVNSTTNNQPTIKSSVHQTDAYFNTANHVQQGAGSINTNYYGKY